MKMMMMAEKDVGTIEVATEIDAHTSEWKKAGGRRHV